ncbi:cytochrome c-type biogenesis protein CcmF [bacterium BMS3Bbin12]|nr:cytochrome c-type biogenesis protein CcmF [bacterium BMS3Abin12]GBE48927.1 cytochrome c-type biogenesis protein CcmF [bacterium BMS3Bbin12]GBE49831.1 cytochrome c-type biogenesis protein CcmF [bacterium BMS3Bbin13]HDJ85626.1 heme lyase CcmF/NrfE family subunit [Chromatiales bacterium]HDK02263.1 heme lyase CcmF/NrfE family subunit [Gammaproteobacteria bacterium]
MIPEVGQFALMLALGLALVQATLPLLGAWRGVPEWIAVARPAARAQSLFVLLALLCLTYAFLTNDFSVAYVAENSNTALPWFYRIGAVWGAHEGSLLLWASILSVWTLVVTFRSRSLPPDFTARVLGVMGWVSVGFLLFMLIASNPFTRMFPVPLNGRDLNPLLQNPGLVLHPPLLYMGYVGFVVPFAFAISALLDGRLDAAWARWSRPWTTAAWLFLTLGIAVGSWWSYSVLGWGGWWFWDPVENASFMPWLVGTALIHSLAVTDKRGAFKSWTVLLAIFAFSLSLLGTFLVRSGVLVSVHAFATDPRRGIFILMFLAVVVGLSLLLYAWRAPTVKGGGNFHVLSRETLLLVNNVLLISAAFAVLLGTLYPLILEGMAVGKISVGPPYFNTVFVPLTLPIVFLAAIGAGVRWKQQKLRPLLRYLWPPFVVCLAAGIGFSIWYTGEVRALVIVAVVSAFWVMLLSARDIWGRIRRNLAGANRWYRVPRHVLGMTLAHFGLGVFVLGVTLAGTGSMEKDVNMAPGDSVSLAGYTFRFEGVTKLRGPNYTATQGAVSVSRDGHRVALLHPQKRVYIVQTSPMTEAGIQSGLFRDLYVSLGDPTGGGAWAMRIYYKPMVRWIWLGALFMALGGLVAALDRRYRLTVARGAAPAPRTPVPPAHPVPVSPGNP